MTNEEVELLHKSLLCALTEELSQNAAHHVRYRVACGLDSILSDEQIALLLPEDVKLLDAQHIRISERDYQAEHFYKRLTRLRGGDSYGFA